jgi:hypothetical protein
METSMNAKFSLDDLGHFVALAVLGLLVVVATVESVAPVTSGSIASASPATRPGIAAMAAVTKAP